MLEPAAASQDLPIRPAAGTASRVNQKEEKAHSKHAEMEQA